MTDATPEQIVAFLTGAKAMSMHEWEIRHEMARDEMRLREEIKQVREELADVRADAVLLRNEIERLRAALQFYAEPGCYRSLPYPILVDGGERARRALEPKP